MNNAPPHNYTHNVVLSLDIYIITTQKLNSSVKNIFFTKICRHWGVNKTHGLERVFIIVKLLAHFNILL